MVSTNGQLQDVILTTENCRYCLMCRHIVPLEKVAPREDYSPHGMALIVASVQRGLIDWNAGTIDMMFSAVDGGNSRAHCVTDQPLPEALAAVRAQLVAEKRAPPAVYQTHDRIKKWETPFAEQSPEAVTGKGDAALFVGDEAKYLWPSALEAALKLLKATGIKPVLIGVGRTSGLLPASLGFPETARDLAKTTLAELDKTGAKKLLVLSAGDYYTFKQAYPERLGIEFPKDVELAETLDLLAQSGLNFKKKTGSQAHAYVDPSHAVRVSGRHDIPRKLLTSLMGDAGCELFWRRERAHPVGSTYLQFTKPGLADKLTTARLSDAQSVGARMLITEDPATLYHLNRFAGDYGLSISGMYELLAEQL
jgi:Fe-S oxidoreductase